MLAILLTLFPAVTPQVPSLVQAPIAAQPTDVAVTPNADFGFVRATAPTGGAAGSTVLADHLSVWDMQTRTRVTMVPLGGGTLPPAGFGEYGPLREAADLIEVDNLHALCGGSIEGLTATTFIDVVQFPDATNSNATLVSTLALSAGSGTASSAPAGLVNDVAITPNGKIGVVNFLNSVTFIKMRTGTVLLTQNLMPLGLPAGQSTTVKPEGATDSIALTDEFAAVISTRIDPTTGNHMPWIFIFNLTPTTGPVVQWASAFANISPSEIDSIARSVRIPPNHSQVVMTADYIVASKPLTGGGANQFPNFYLDGNEGRPYLVIRDSLEVTNTRAVALSNDKSTTPLQGRVTVFDISSPAALAPFTPVDFGATVTNRPNDQAISPDGSIAVIKAEEKNVFVALPNSSSPLVSTVASIANPLPSATNAAFVSDSVLISDDGTTAIMIGSRQNPVSPFHWQGVVEFIPLQGGTISPQIMSDPVKDIFAADLKLTRGGSRVLVRFKTTSGLPPGSALGQDFDLYNFTGESEGQLAADGDTFRLDDVEVGIGAAIGIAETQVAPPNQVTGHVHLIQW